MSSEVPRSLRKDVHQARIVRDVEQLGLAVGSLMLWRQKQARQVLGPTATIAEAILFTVLGQALVRGKDPHVDMQKAIKLSELPASTVSRIITKFIDLGLIREEIDPDDRRKRRHTITEAGMQLGVEAVARRRHLFMTHTEPYPED